MTAVELAGIKALVKQWCGCDIHFIDGGPSVIDHGGLAMGYISVRDQHGNAWGVKISHEGKMEHL